MKKILSLLLVLMMTSMLFVGCGSKDTKKDSQESQAADTEESAAETEESSEEAAPASSSDVRVAMITDYGDITDQSFNQTTYEACKAFCDGQWC